MRSGQRKMPNYGLAGVAHILIFIAFQVLLLNSVMLWAQGYDRNFDFLGTFEHTARVW